MSTAVVEPGIQPATYVAGSEFITKWTNASQFDLMAYLKPFDPRLLEISQGRIALTRTRPLLFALLYLPHLLKDRDGSITWADTHLSFAQYGRTWIRHGGLRTDRNVFVAPRESAKSTWLFKILPLWAAAHGHVKFVAAFSSSGSQAESHLSGFKNELDTNLLLRQDFPLLCKAAKRPTGTAVRDTHSFLFAASGFAFSARGIDADTLGMVDPKNRRPDVIILDDIEPGEDSYSAYQMKGRLTTVLDVVLPMNERAHVALVGTVTMAGSIVHQLVKSKLQPSPDTPNWIADERFKVHYFAPIVDNPDGSQRSIWPNKWPLSYLKSIAHTRGYAKNFLNMPIRLDGDFWTPEDIRYRDVDATSALLSIDPATTNKATSDFYGLAIIAHDSRVRKCAVRYTRAVRLAPAELRREVLKILGNWPEVDMVLIETNQGGDTWREILHGLPVRLRVVHQSTKKEVRAAQLHNRYQRDWVTHATPQPQAEEQMCAYPDVLNDDIIDAIGTGVAFYLSKRNARKIAGVVRNPV